MRPSKQDGSAVQPRGRRPRGRPPKITLDQVVHAAIDAGLDSFTMHGVATSLGVATPTLYSHVRDRDELVELAVHSQLRRFVLPDRTLPWREWLTHYALEYRRHAAALGFPTVIARHDLVTSGGLDLTEDAFVVLNAAGFTDAQAGMALWIIFRAACAHPRGPSQLDRQLAETDAALDDASVPRYQRVAGALRAVRSMPADERFTFELDVILDGLAAQLAEPERG